MINVEFKRNDFIVVCDGCGNEIQAEAPSYRLEFGVQNRIADEVICLCEDCGNDIQNDMSDEYCRFES